MEEALKAATHPHDFKLLVASDGKRSTSYEHVSDREAGPPNGGEPAVSGAPGGGPAG